MCTCLLCAVCPNVTRCSCIWQLDSLPLPSIPSVLCQPAQQGTHSSIFPVSSPKIGSSSFRCRGELWSVRQSQCRSKTVATPCGRAVKAVPLLLGQTVCLSQIQRFKWLDAYLERQISCSWWRKTKLWPRRERRMQRSTTKKRHENGAFRPGQTYIQVLRFEFKVNDNMFSQSFLRMYLLQLEEIPQE